MDAQRGEKESRRRGKGREGIEEIRRSLEKEGGVRKSGEEEEWRQGGVMRRSGDEEDEW